jgi:hypothetical protein
MDSDFISTILVRIFLIFIAAALVSLFYNNTIAWNFNLPTIGFWEFVLGFWAMRFSVVAIYKSLTPDNDR